MGINLFENRRFSINTISCLWQRIPFIISCEDANKRNDLLLKLADFIPEYRQIIVSGNVPRTFEFSQKKPRKLDSTDLATLHDSLSSSFEEERAGSRPIQLIYFDATEDSFSDVLSNLEQGWLATTALGYEDLLPVIEIVDLESIDDCTIIFMRPNENTEIEEQLFDKSEQRSLEVASFIFQLKMSEINLIGSAILKEIENGKNMTQVEIKELFNIDELTLQRVMYLLQVESKMDVQPYIIFTPKAVLAQLQRFVNLNGIVLSGAIQNNRLIGLSKDKNIQFSVSNLFHSIVSYYNQVRAQYAFGGNFQMIIELKDTKKVLFLTNNDYTYAFLIDTNKNINILTEEIVGLLA
jgi:hypothetical protein